MKNIHTQNLLDQTTYHNIYCDDGMAVLRGKESVQDIKDLLVQFNQTVDNAAGNQHLQFTAEIWTNGMDPPPYTKKDKVQIVANGKFPFLDMKMRCSHEGGL